MGFANEGLVDMDLVQGFMSFQLGVVFRGFSDLCAPPAGFLGAMRPSSTPCFMGPDDFESAEKTEGMPGYSAHEIPRFCAGSLGI